MGLTRVFYGHEGSIPPLGLYASAEAEPAEIPEAIVEEIVLPDSKAKAAELDAFAEEHGIVFEDGAKVKDKRAAIEEWAANLPELHGADTLEDAEVPEGSEAADDEPAGDDEGADADATEE